MSFGFLQSLRDAVTAGKNFGSSGVGSASSAGSFGSGRFQSAQSNSTPSQQDVNNAYTFAEMEYANQLQQNNAREANKVAHENATTAFERQKELQNMAMAFNADEAQKARDYDERMSNTAYQRAMADMKAAGLNPILAYSQGGAASGGGQAASVGVSSAVQAESYMPDTERQYIDIQSNAALKRAYVQTVGNLLSSFINSASRVVRAPFYGGD